LAGSFNEMIEGLQQREFIQRTFGRYVDNNVAKELMSNPDAFRLGGEKRTVTIMMADLRNFTSVAEQLKPEEVIRLLNRYFSRMIAVVERHKGIIVDFFGDSILVFFNGLKADVATRAVDAVQCALEMQHEYKGFAVIAKAAGFPELQMGIGIHTGDVIVGNIGTETRAKYGIVGSDVNLTSRIQSTAGGGRTVISEETYRILGDRVKVSGDFRVCLKGVGRDRELYEVESLNNKEAP
jgi:adenylate cyclase